MQSRRERLSSSRTIILKPVEWIGSCPVQHKPGLDLKTIAIVWRSR